MFLCFLGFSVAVTYPCLRGHAFYEGRVLDICMRKALDRSYSIEHGNRGQQNPKILEYNNYGWNRKARYA